MSRLTNSARSAHASAIGYLNGSEIPRPSALHLLSVGPPESACILHDALFDRQNWRMTIAIDARELWVIPAQQSIHVAVLHCALSTLELEEACMTIRRRWPMARILVIREGEGFLDDGMYDDRQMPYTAPHLLLRAMERLAAESRERRPGDLRM